MGDFKPLGKSPLDRFFEAWHEYELLKLYLSLYFYKDFDKKEIITRVEHHHRGEGHA